MRIAILSLLASSLVAGKIYSGKTHSEKHDQTKLRGAVTNSGNCGEELQQACQEPAYPCCSSSNWCGNEAQWCDNQQEKWKYVPPPPQPWSKESHCLLEFKDKCSPDALEDGYCVSAFGWCGNTPDHCNENSLFSWCCNDGYDPTIDFPEAEPASDAQPDAEPASDAQPASDAESASEPASDTLSASEPETPKFPPNTGGGSCTAPPSAPEGWDVVPPASFRRQFATEYIEVKDKQSSEMSKLGQLKTGPQCPYGYALAGFQTERTYDRKKIRIQYYCDALPNYPADTYQKETSCINENSDSGYVSSLRSHPMFCGAGAAMTGWKLDNNCFPDNPNWFKLVFDCVYIFEWDIAVKSDRVHQPVYANQMVSSHPTIGLELSKYSFYQTKGRLENIKPRSPVIFLRTKANENGGVIYTDRHQIICPPDFILTAVRVADNNGNAYTVEPDQVSYSYACRGLVLLN